MIIKPLALRPGSTIGIIAPAGPAHDSTWVADGKTILETLGFRVILGSYALHKNRYLAGTDSERLYDLHRMFSDNTIDGIVCLRGGYGTMRLLSGIDYRVIRHNPKVMVGYSDITALQLAIWKRTGLVTFSGPMLVSDFARRPEPFTLHHFIDAVTTSAPLGLIPAAPGNKGEVINPGRARGRLLGGNLSLITATLGTPYEIDTRGAILFLEEVNEQPYRIDRMLQQLQLAEKFRFVSGVIFGEFTGCEAENTELSFTVPDVIRETFLSLNVPCFCGLSVGHGQHKATLPLGVNAEMDAEQCRLVITEAATC